MTIIGVLNKTNGHHGQIKSQPINTQMNQFITKFSFQQFTQQDLDIC